MYLVMAAEAELRTHIRTLVCCQMFSICNSYHVQNVWILLSLFLFYYIGEIREYYDSLEGAQLF